MYAIATTVLQKHLNDCWEIVDDGAPIEEVLSWLRLGGHRTIDDIAAKMVADLMEQGKRS